ncbi:MAG: TetR/AcrR family transcriptional regulator [Clostridia bacterium]|nr:TetR/AcrR family transcriptional regulator [Clostridia bacterium]
MNNSKTKYNNSSWRMSEALLRLLDEKPLDNITIKELCGEAGVNRSTFYAHYGSIEDILEETRTGIVENFIKDVRKKAQDGVEDDILTAYLELIRKHRNFYKVHMETTSPLAFTDMFKERVTKRLEDVEKAEGVDLDGNRLEYMARYHLVGIYAVIKKWVDSGCEESVDYIHGIIHECTIGD